jgi:hypothetical protein
MNTQTLILCLTLIGLTVIGGLVWLAVLGYVLAYLVLAILGTVGLIGLGLSFGLIHTRITAERQQQAFLDNAQENLSIMSALQNIQNKQNQTLMQQLGQVSRLPQHPPPPSNFFIEDGIFDDLEN